MLTVTGRQFVTSRRGELRSGHGTSDAALISAIAGSDRDAMHVLYVRHSVRVYRFVLRLTNDSSLAEDLVSEVFIDVWRGARGFKEKSQVSTWLLAIARNKTLAAMRARLDEQMKWRRQSQTPPTMRKRPQTSGIEAPSLSTASRSFRRCIEKSSFSSTITKNQSTRSPKLSGRRQAP